LDIKEEGEDTKVVNLVCASLIAIFTLVTGQFAMAQKRDPDCCEDVSRQRISRLSSQAVFVAKNKMEKEGISHMNYDFFVRIEGEKIYISANYRTDESGVIWNNGIRGCSARGRAPCRAFVLRKSDFEILTDNVTTQ
jgi:hypothetical protein